MSINQKYVALGRFQYHPYAASVNAEETFTPNQLIERLQKAHKKGTKKTLSKAAAKEQVQEIIEQLYNGGRITPIASSPAPEVKIDLDSEEEVVPQNLLTAEQAVAAAKTEKKPAKKAKRSGADVAAQMAADGIPGVV